MSRVVELLNCAADGDCTCPLGVVEDGVEAEAPFAVENSLKLVHPTVQKHYVKGAFEGKLVEAEHWCWC